MSESAAPVADPVVAEARAHRDAQRWLPAIAQFRRAVEQHPDDATLFFELGDCYRHTGDFGRAIHAFERAITLDPDLLQAYRSGADTALAQAQKVGLSSKAAGDLKKFAAMYLTALSQRQRHPTAGDAEASLREAIALDPKNGDAHYKLGELLEGSGRYTEAEKLLRRTIALDPKLAAAYVVLGNVLQSLGRYKEMEAAYRHALAIKPELHDVRQSLMSFPLLHLLYDSDATADEVFRRHREWGDWAVDQARKADPGIAQPLVNVKDRDRRLKVAFLSPDFRYHAVSFFFEPFLAHHDRSALDVYCYAEVEHPDMVTVALQQLGGIWRQTHGIGDKALRDQLRADQIDIAIDMAGHMGHNRLLALAIKPAPVTATWLGYPATTGLTTIDWRITDARADPPRQERYHTERLMRLPKTFLCYHFYGSEIPQIAEPPAMTCGTVTFGSFNNPMKLSPPTIRAWSRILAKVPDSRLLLKSWLFAESSRAQYFLERFAVHGIPRERIVLRQPFNDLMEHLRSYNEIDLALDPFPYNGTTTTCEAMWMGVPVVSLVGGRHSGRVGYDLLSQVGMEEFVAPDVDAYVAKATELALDRPRLARLRAVLRPRMEASSLCDAPGFSRAFETGLREMWHDWCG